MNSLNDDLFAFSDDDMFLPQLTTNPIESHLSKQFADIQSRIDATANEIEEVKVTTARILNILEWHALYGEDVVSDSDNDLYTVEGEPAIKKKQCARASNRDKNLEIVSLWQCVLEDKWIIGVELQNRLQRTLDNARYYPWVRDEVDICGDSMLWQLQRDNFWKKIDSIRPGAVHVVATTVLHLPTFDRESVVDCWGTISYEMDESRFQSPVPLVQLSAAETIDCSCIKLADGNEHSAILSLKSTCTVERIVNVRFSSIDDRHSGHLTKYRSDNKRLFHFLAKQAFEKIYGDVFLAKANGSLMYCLIEVLSLDVGETSIRICARSINQLNIMLHLLRDEFPNVNVVEEINNCVEAAMALIRELEVIRDKKSPLEIQRAKLMTDLLIP